MRSIVRLLVGCLAGLGLCMPANAQVRDWSGLYLGIHAGFTDGIKATPWASAEVDEKRRIPGTPPELISEGYCYGEGGPVGALGSKEACENPNRVWDESPSGCFGPGGVAFGEYGSQSECEEASNQPAVEYEWADGGFCVNTNTYKRVEANPTGCANGNALQWYESACFGPDGTLDPNLTSQEACTGASIPGTPELTWHPGGQRLRRLPDRGRHTRPRFAGSVRGAICLAGSALQRGYAGLQQAAERL